MPGYKVWQDMDILSAADLNSYLMGQTVMRFADAATRQAELPAPVAGQISYLVGVGRHEKYDGTAWVELTPPAATATDFAVSGTLSVSGTSTLTGAVTTGAGITAGGTVAIPAGSYLTIGADANLYRSAINQLATDDSLAIGGTLSVTGATGLTGPVTTGGNITMPDAGVLAIGDANLYRSAANVLKTDDALAVTGALTVTGLSTLSGGLSTSGDLTTTGVVNAAAVTTANLSTATRVNLIPNPSFESNTTGWTAAAPASLARSTAQAWIGSASAALTYGSSTSPLTTKIDGSLVPVTVGVRYTASCYMRANTTSRTCRIHINWHSANTAASQIDSQMSAAFTDSNATWTRVSTSGTAPAGATHASVSIYAASAASGEIHYVDAVLFEAATGVSPYFDGTSTGASWSGSAHASTSSMAAVTLGTSPLIWSDVMLTRPTNGVLRTDGSLTVDGSLAVGEAAYLTIGSDITARRSAAGVLEMDNGLHLDGTHAANVTLVVEGANAQSANLQDWRSNGSSSPLTAIDASGSLVFAGDTNLYRSAANTLKTDDNLAVAGGTLTLNDTSIYRYAADHLRTDNRITIVRPTEGSVSFATWVSGDTTQRFTFAGTGRMSWGPGSAATNAHIYWLGTATMKLENNLEAAGYVRVGQYATASRPAASTAGAGGMVWDSTLGKPIWSDGTNWKDATGTTV